MRKRHAGVLGLLVIIVAVVVTLLLTTSGGRHVLRHYHVLPRPPLPPTQTVPAPSRCRHTMGGCLPRPKTTGASGLSAETTRLAAFEFVVSSSETGPDFSNNNAVPASAFAKIAGRNSFVYLKSTEGTSFTDGTAKAMASAAKSRGLKVGGYDFLHVCQDGAVAEADHFVSALRSQGLLGAGTLPPAADAEYGNGSCGGRVWLQNWTDTVYKLTGRCPIEYTGAWWWQPDIGAWWPTCRNVKLTSWISGYGVSYPYMPSGDSTLNLWQYADNGFNGYNNADLSKWYSGSFAAFVGSTPKPSWWAPNLKKLDKTRHKLKGRNIDERDSVRAWAADHCLNPVRRPVCKRIKIEAGLEKARIDFLAKHGPAPKYRALAKPNWAPGKPGAYGTRNTILQHLLTMTKGT